MALSALSYITQTEYQRKTHWDFYFVDNSLGFLRTDFYFKYKIKSVSFPQPSFEIDSKSTWENFYKGYNYDTNFSIEIYEDIQFSTWNYFNTWKNDIYDKDTRRFISYTRDKFDARGLLYRTALLNYYPTGFVIDAVPSKRFLIDNIKLVNLGNIENNYTDGDALTYIVSFVFEKISEV